VCTEKDGRQRQSFQKPSNSVGAARISHCVHDVAVAQEVLQRAGIDPVIGFFAEASIWDNETELFTARMDALVLRPHRRLGPLSGYRSFDALQIGVDGR
jgi:hypothetical protein